MMIDLADCDALLPSVFDIRPSTNRRDFDSGHRPYLFNSALISLSVLLGRILKSVYSPSESSCSVSIEVAVTDEAINSWNLVAFGEGWESSRFRSCSVRSYLSLHSRF